MTLRSVIVGAGCYLPARLVSNAELAQKVDTSDEWIVQRTGIRERHIAADGEFTSHLGIKAAQAALADAIGGDKTRLIPVLDDLQQRGLIRRERDPADRRVHLLSLTTSGRALHDTVQQQIQRNEARLLGRLPAREQQRFLDAVRVLADRPERDLDTSAS